MRCHGCNEELTDQEAVRKDEHEQYLDLCNECAGYVDIDWVYKREKNEYDGS